MSGDATDGFAQIVRPARPQADEPTVASGVPLVDIVAAPGQLGIDARPLAGSGRAGAFLAGYLRSDIAGSARAARAVLAHLDAIDIGSATRWSECGNAYELTLDPRCAGLTFAYADDPADDRVQFASASLRAALEAWIAALESGPLPA